MKFLGNRGFVIVLAIFAVGLVSKNLVWPLVSRNFGVRRASAAAPPATPAAKPPEPEAQRANAAPPRENPAGTSTVIAVPSLGNGAPVAPMDVSGARSASTGWAASPHRDPFHVRGGIKDGRSARELLKLTGTLNQTGSTLAVLNNRVLAAGDTILEFKLEKVEADRVWVVGPNGRESVEFRYIAEIVARETARDSDPAALTVQ